MLIGDRIEFKDLNVGDFHWEELNGKHTLIPSEFFNEQNGTLINWHGHLAILSKDKENLTFLPKDKYIQLQLKKRVEK